MAKPPPWETSQRCPTPAAEEGCVRALPFPRCDNASSQPQLVLLMLLRWDWGTKCPELLPAKLQQHVRRAVAMPNDHYPSIKTGSKSPQSPQESGAAIRLNPCLHKSLAPRQGPAWSLGPSDTSSGRGGQRWNRMWALVVCYSSWTLQGANGKAKVTRMVTSSSF